jgi:hypothetical protein
MQLISRSASQGSMMPRSPGMIVWCLAIFASGEAAASSG